MTYQFRTRRELAKALIMGCKGLGQTPTIKAVVNAIRQIEQRRKK